MNQFQSFRALLALYLGCVMLNFSVAASSSGNGKSTTVVPLGDDVPSGTGFAHQAPTEREKEYRQLAQKLRDDDVAFEKAWRSAKAVERQQLRADRLKKLEPTLIRMHALSREIAGERKSAAQTNSTPIPVSGPVTPPDEVKGKSEQELAQMGVAVKQLHQKKDAEANAAATAQGSATK